MITKYVKGDLFKTPLLVIAHGCNAQGVMGSGVAKIVKDKYPEAYKAYKERYDSATDKHLSALPLGDMSVSNSNGLMIVNMVTQKNYGRDGERYVSYDAVSACFSSLNRYFKGTAVAIPKIGAGLGGGDWNVIEAIINSETPDVEIWVYEL